MLKVVELVHKLDISRLQKAEDREDDEIGAAGGIRYGFLFRNALDFGGIGVLHAQNICLFVSIHHDFDHGNVVRRYYVLAAAPGSGLFS